MSLSTVALIVGLIGGIVQFIVLQRFVKTLRQSKNSEKNASTITLLNFFSWIDIVLLPLFLWFVVSLGLGEV